VTRVEAQGLLEVLDGGPHVAAQEERRAEIVVGGRVARAHAHLLLGQGDRLVELAVLELGPTSLTEIAAGYRVVSWCKGCLSNTVVSLASFGGFLWSQD
jgi:hypothetical protein